ncbi:MAG TPA: purine-nucleoside phosphorylase [Actinomycetota bacterium]|nr:purine-nucleoside phosphorylase [Actinomycetota bacterium]
MRIALIAGSGLRAIADRLGGLAEAWTPPGIPPGSRPEAPGHRLEVVEGRLGGHPALAFCGRLHYYQGYSAAQVVSTVTHAADWGADLLVVTNASGSTRTEIAPGDIGVIKDHINLMPDNPLRGQGATAEFLDLAAAYDPALREALAAAAEARGLRVPEVVYVAVAGPSFETPAEVRMLRMLGGDVVGMSTVPEVITARRRGLRVLALTVVTNRAGAPATAHDVLRAAETRAGDVADLLEDFAAAL